VSMARRRTKCQTGRVDTLENIGHRRRRRAGAKSGDSPPLSTAAQRNMMLWPKIEGALGQSGVNPKSETRKLGTPYIKRKEFL